MGGHVNEIDVVTLNDYLLGIDAEIQAFYNADPADRGRYPQGENIRSLQEAINLNADGALGPDTANETLGLLSRDLNGFFQDPPLREGSPFNFQNYPNLRDFLYELNPEAVQDYSESFFNYSQSHTTLALQQSLYTALETAMGYCAEETILSLDSIFADTERFAELSELAADRSGGAAVELNEHIREVLSTECGHILEQFAEADRGNVLTSAAADVQTTLTTLMSQPAPEMPERPAPEPPENGFGPNGEVDASYPTSEGATFESFDI